MIGEWGSEAAPRFLGREPFARHPAESLRVAVLPCRHLLQHETVAVDREGDPVAPAQATCVPNGLGDRGPAACPDLGKRRHSLPRCAGRVVIQDGVLLLKCAWFRVGRSVSPTLQFFSSCPAPGSSPGVIRASLSARTVESRANTWMAGSGPAMTCGVSADV